MVVLLGGALLAGVCVGFIGAGGGILAVPLLTYGARLSPHTATSASLVLVGASAAVSSVPYARGGHIDWRRGSILAFSGMVGSWIGAMLSPWLPDRLVLISLALLMLASGSAMLGGRQPLARVSPDGGIGGGDRFFKAAGSGLGIGVITGALGAGGGFLIVPTLHRFLGLSMRAAVGTSVMVITANCAMALTWKARHLHALWTGPVTAATAIALCAAFASSRLSHRVSQPALKRLFAVFVLALGAAILFKENLPAP
ncbi:MAG: sulfite exporter TauE/SafE family protein [Deltaproteobacteria bacterium]|nr:sulfite exporter TauE/SafE family protein [Deltaproteobacteria bacterium]